jgi:hypothetical protein
MCTSCYCSIALVVAFCNANNIFFGDEIFNPQKKKSAKIKCLIFSQKSQKFRGYIKSAIYHNRNILKARKFYISLERLFFNGYL